MRHAGLHHGGRVSFCHRRKRCPGRVFIAGVLLIWLPTVAMSAEDFRMTVEIPAEGKASAQPSLAAVMRQAVPVLWDRLIPQEERVKAKVLTGTPRMVSRIVPAKDVTRVEFDRQAVFDYLGRAHMAFMASPPVFHLAIKMRNSVGMPMPQTEALLLQYAEDMARRWGFRLSVSAPELVINWIWVDAHRAMLSLEGAAAPPDAVEQERDIGEEDPLAFMQAWLKTILLDTRDRLGASHNQKKAIPQDGRTIVWLLIERPLSLGEQAVLEDAIRSDPRVVRLIPHTYSHQRLRYRLIVAGQDTAWVAEWFRQRAFQVSPAPDGWHLQ